MAPNGAGVEDTLAGVPERRVPKVVRQGDGFSQLRREASMQQRLLNEQVVGNGPGDLGHFDAVGQAGPIKIRLADPENLGLSLEPAECRTVQDSIPISFGRMPVIPWGSRAFGITPLQQKLVHSLTTITWNAPATRLAAISRAFQAAAGYCWLLHYSL